MCACRADKQLSRLYSYGDFNLATLNKVPSKGLCLPCPPHPVALTGCVLQPSHILALLD